MGLGVSQDLYSSKSGSNVGFDLGLGSSRSFLYVIACILMDCSAVRCSLIVSIFVFER